MTIATCLVLPEGIVFGVDSTTSANVGEGFHYLNHHQKLFEVGVEGTLAVMTWGLSHFGDISYRTLIADLADEISPVANLTVEKIANIWIKKGADIDS